jgi:hypothetical protein
MGDNEAINTLTGVAGYSGCYWHGDYINSKDLANNLIYTGDSCCINSNLDYRTLNEDVIKEVVEKIAKKRELAKITPDEGPEIPKWTGFLPI